jgi:integrase
MTDLISEYETWLLGRRRSAVTVTQYVALLRRMDRQMPNGVTTCSLEELIDWIYDDDRRRGETTYAHYTTIVRGFGQWLTDPADPWLDWHAAEDLPDAQADSATIRPATEAEFGAIREQAAAPWIDLYELAGWAGLRCVEICRAQREHLTEREIRVHGKGGKWRRVPLHPVLWERFAGRPPGALARNRDGSPMSRTQVISRGDYHLLRGGVSMHQLRKRFATRIYKESNHDIRLVQHLLGHRYVNTTQRYLGIDEDEAAEVVSRLAVAA